MFSTSERHYLGVLAQDALCLQTILSRADFLHLPTITLWLPLSRYRKALGQ